jgi:F-type H+-transporting ATPase subunit b
MLNTKRIAAGFGLVAASSSSALAAGGHGDFSFTIEGFYIIDFVILVGLLFFLLKGPARKFIEGRHDRIKAELEAATRLREEAEARLRDLDAMVRGLESEIAVVREQFRQDGEREAARIQHETTSAVARLDGALAKQREQETAKLREALEHELVAAVLKSTEAKLKQKLDAKTQAAVANDFIEALEKVPSLDKIGHAA